MEEKNRIFKEYIEAFKELDTDRKREEFIKSLKDFIVIFILMKMIIIKKSLLDLLMILIQKVYI